MYTTLDKILNNSKSTFKRLPVVKQINSFNKGRTYIATHIEIYEGCIESIFFCPKGNYSSADKKEHLNELYYLFLNPEIPDNDYFYLLGIKYECFFSGVKLNLSKKESDKQQKD